jgi:branched-chain amino acid transport system substrate-binding protein
MRKALLTVLALALVLALMAGGAWAETLKIGSMSPLTGPYAADGNDIKQGVLTAIEVIEEEGGIPGYDEIELSAQDTACDPRQAVAAANKLINEGVTGVVGAYCSSSTIPASEVLAEEDIIMITPASTNEKVTERGLKNMFRTCGRDDDQSKTAAAFADDFLGAESIFLVDDKTTYSQGLADNVAKECEKRGIEVLAREHVNQGDKDFAAVLTKVKSMKPDVFYVCLQNSATGALMIIQAERMGVESTILTQDAVFHPQLIEVGKDAVEGVYLTYGSVEKEKPAYKKFYEHYQPKYGEPGSYSSYAYDSAMVYLTAVKRAGGTDMEKVREEILKIDMEGASKPINYKENGDSGSNYIVLVVDGGEFKKFWNPRTGEKY